MHIYTAPAFDRTLPKRETEHISRPGAGSFDLSLVVAIILFILFSTILFLVCFLGPWIRKRRRAQTPITPKPASPAKTTKSPLPKCMQPHQPSTVSEAEKSGPGFGFDGLSAAALEELRMKEVEVKEEGRVGEEKKKKVHFGEEEHASRSLHTAKISETPPVLSLQDIPSVPSFHFTVDLWKSEEGRFK
ncbi:hypothetical protein BDZ89DRAFT_1129186 [Hymenopellis radicata]|nr:hypothetical protein BDZ89DRAFT_1129186 [Hymenopellis radicata]